jgi:hypothetical protein
MNKNKKKRKIVLTFLAQQYGLTINDLLKRYNDIKKEDILVETYEGQYWDFT